MQQHFFPFHSLHLQSTKSEAKGHIIVWKRVSPNCVKGCPCKETKTVLQISVNWSMKPY